MIYRTTFRVIPLRGTAFPIDMLRYDACHPASEDESHRIEQVNLDYTMAVRSDVQSVELERLHDGKANRLTDARWRSFGWAIDPASVVTRKA